MNSQENPEIGMTPETENRPDYHAIIVLGGGFIKKVDPQTKTEKFVLSQDSRIRVTASGILAETFNVPEIIYSGGKTAGPDNPSEAEAMYAYAKRLYPDIEERRVALEDKSWDTSTNAEYAAKILEENGVSGPIILLSSGYHLGRADHHFMQHGIDATPMAAEEAVATRSAHHKEYIRKKLNSLGNLKEETVEAILRTLLVFDPSGEIPKRITQGRLERK